MCLRAGGVEKLLRNEAMFKKLLDRLRKSAIMIVVEADGSGSFFSFLPRSQTKSLRVKSPRYVERKFPPFALTATADVTRGLCVFSGGSND